MLDFHQTFCTPSRSQHLFFQINSFSWLNIFFSNTVENLVPMNYNQGMPLFPHVKRDLKKPLSLTLIAIDQLGRKEPVPRCMHATLHGFVHEIRHTLHGQLDKVCKEQLVDQLDKVVQLAV